MFVRRFKIIVIFILFEHMFEQRDMLLAFIFLSEFETTAANYNKCVSLIILKVCLAVKSRLLLTTC